MNNQFDTPSWEQETRSPPQGGSGDGSSFDLRGIAWKYKYYLVICLLGGAILGELAYRKLGPEYQAIAQILVSKSANVQVKQEGGGDESFGERAEHIALIMSPMIVGKAVEVHRLNELPTLSRSETPIDDILDDLKVKRSAGHDRSYLNVLDITFNGPSAEDAKSIVDAVIDAYKAYLAESYRENSAEVLKLTKEAKETLFEQLQARQQEYLTFRETAPLQWKAPVAGSTTQTVTNIHQENIQAIQEQRRQNLIKRTDVTSKLKSLEEAIESGESQDSLTVLVRQFMNQEGQQNNSAAAISMAGPSASSSYESQLLPLLMLEQKLLHDEGLGPKHPEVVNVRKSIEALGVFFRQRGIELPRQSADGQPIEANGVDFVSIYVRSLKQQLLALEHRDQELDELYAKEESLARNHSKYLVKEQILTDEINRIKGLYDLVEARLNQEVHIRPNQSYTLKIVAPTKDELMIKRHIMFLGGGVAICVGCLGGLIYLNTMRDTTLKTNDEIRHHLPSTLLGTIPEYDVSSSSTKDSLQPGLHPALCYLHHPGSHEAEAYRSLRTAMFVGLHDQHFRVVQVSSPEPADGKSTVAANLALAAAQSGKNVLLIDADLRRPTQHQLFKLRDDIGLSEVLENEIDVRSAIQVSSIPNLSVLTSGRIPASPAELLSSVRWDQMLLTIRNDFDLIIVDTPPLLAVSDPCIIAPRIDGLLLVVHLFKTTRSAIAKSRQLLEMHHIRVLGSVANGQPEDSRDPYANRYYETYTPRRENEIPASASDAKMPQHVR
ncbi:MAG: polysaccharide biosynthesis tyrosine autokinase [Planctomycetaceae bacterium]